MTTPTAKFYLVCLFTMLMFNAGIAQTSSISYPNFLTDTWIVPDYSLSNPVYNTVKWQVFPSRLMVVSAQFTAKTIDGQTVDIETANIWVNNSDGHYESTLHLPNNSPYGYYTLSM